MADAQLREILTDAIGYWEPRRLFYNVVLALVVVIYFFVGWPGTKAVLSVDLGLTIFVLAVLANVAYCAAYAVDVFIQFSSFRIVWLRHRWALFLIGLIFAGIITRFFSLGLFGAAV